MIVCKWHSLYMQVPLVYKTSATYMICECRLLIISAVLSIVLLQYFLYYHYSTFATIILEHCKKCFRTNEKPVPKEMKNLHDINKKPFAMMTAKGFYVLGVRLLLSWVRRIRFFSRNYNSVSFVLGNFRINQLDTAIVLLCLYESNMNGKKNRGDIHTSRNCD